MGEKVRWGVDKHYEGPFQSHSLVDSPRPDSWTAAPTTTGCPKDVHFLKASVPCTPSEKK